MNRQDKRNLHKNNERVSYELWNQSFVLYEYISAPQNAES